VHPCVANGTGSTFLPARAHFCHNHKVWESPILFREEYNFGLRPRDQIPASPWLALSEASVGCLSCFWGQKLEGRLNDPDHGVAEGRTKEDAILPLQFELAKPSLTLHLVGMRILS
jgi:hypothetical protein